MCKGTYTYEYPRPSVTSDCVIFGYDAQGLSVLLIERGQNPFKGCWTFPGGFTQVDDGTVRKGTRNPIKYSFNKESYEQMKAKGYRLEF